ncbi:MAG: sulfatase-like hydrolase/transferase [Hyphomonadaceae bacterium]|nr:sulfatase-like hydrolase/transferase [Hyphomonadaceae bacterium]
MRLRIAASGLALLGFAACQSSGPNNGAQEAFDFGGVYEDTYAGEIDRTVIPRRPDGPPNVVLIIADDLGWPYLGFLGDDNVITPNMDIIGNGGALFEVGHSTSNHCRPTLQSLITGLYPVQYERRANQIAEATLQSTPLPAGVDTDREKNILKRQYETAAIEQFETLPRLLAEVGYVSHQSGKWWEQSYAHGGFTHGMTETWDWQDAADLGDRWFFTFMGGRGNEIGRTTMAPVESFIQERAEQPFFLWYGPALPHTPLNAPDRFWKYYENRDDLSESAKLYYANIAWFDWGVGQVLDTLREERLLDNTLIVYVNDNGWEQAGDVEYADNHITLANGGPRGKGSFFETGFRTPIIFYWQGEITAMRDTETLASAIDILPTILDYVGLDAPEGLPGYSLKPKISGGALDQPRDYFVGRMTQHRAGTDFRGHPNNATNDHMGSALGGYYRRDLDWHFVWLPDRNETALYDLQNDPGQLIDMSAAHPDKVEAFKSDIDAWRATYEADAP